jgi:hypothetical protein
MILKAMRSLINDFSVKVSVAISKWPGKVDILLANLFPQVWVIIWLGCFMIWSSSLID